MPAPVGYDSSIVNLTRALAAPVEAKRSTSLLRMRLTRVGAKKRPSYRVVVADSQAPRDGRHVDILGYYDPMTTPSTVRIDSERAVRWLQNGAEPSERVRILLRHAGVLTAHEEARIAARRARRAAGAEDASAPSA